MARDKQTAAAALGDTRVTRRARGPREHCATKTLARSGIPKRYCTLAYRLDRLAPEPTVLLPDKTDIAGEVLLNNGCSGKAFATRKCSHGAPARATMRGQYEEQIPR